MWGANYFHLMVVKDGVLCMRGYGRKECLVMIRHGGEQAKGTQRRHTYRCKCKPCHVVEDLCSSQDNNSLVRKLLR